MGKDQNTADVKAVSEVIGHKDIGITLGTYAHVMPNQRQDVVDKVGSGLSEDQNDAPTKEQIGPDKEPKNPS